MPSSVRRKKRAAAPSAALTAPAEDYLKAIYELERSGTPAFTSEIATRLAIAAASVSGMVRRLARQGLLTHERYHGVRLTSSGRVVALRTLRRHRIIECYLATELGYHWDGVHEEAERLEHAASDELIERMAQALGDPVVDPHGAPIPTREGTVDETRHKSLADLEEGQRATVLRVSDEDGTFLRYLSDIGITPGVAVQVTALAPYDGPIALKVGKARASVGVTAAKRIIVGDVSLKSKV